MSLTSSHSLALTARDFPYFGVKHQFSVTYSQGHKLPRALNPQTSKNIISLVSLSCIVSQKTISTIISTLCIDICCRFPMGTDVTRIVKLLVCGSMFCWTLSHLTACPSAEEGKRYLVECVSTNKR